MFEVKDLIVGYGGRKVLGPVSFSLAPGRCVLLAGANGSGKSTLLRTLAGLQPCQGGSFTACHVSMVPGRLPKTPGFTVREFLRTSLPGRMASDSAINEAMSLLGIEHLSDRDISQLSDGEFQKACIATALTSLSGLLLLDEPTSFLDVNARRDVLNLIKELAAVRDIPVLFSSHDIHDAEKVADRVMVIADGTLKVSDETSDSKLSLLTETFGEV